MRNDHAYIGDIKTELEVYNMNKRIISGIVALSIVASIGAVTANAVKLGNVNMDGAIDIEDAVAVISSVNGLNPLTPEQEKIADVNKDGTVDIEDAVMIINHINGNAALPDEDVTGEEDSTPDSKPDSSTPDSSTPDSSTPDSSTPDTSEPDDSSEPEVQTVTVALDAGNSFTLKKGETIPQKYGKYPDPADSATWDKDSWYLLSSSTTSVESDGNVYESVLTDIVDEATGISLQQYIEESKPVEADTTFKRHFEKVQKYAFKSKVKFYNSKEDIDNDAEPFETVYIYGNDAETLRTELLNSELKDYQPTKAPEDKDLVFAYWSAGDDVEYTGDITGETGDVSLYPVFKLREFEPGERTIKMFEKLADGNYYFYFKGDGILKGANTDMEVTIKQAEPKKSRIHMIMKKKGKDTTIVIIDKYKFKILDEENKTYTGNLTQSERLMDFNSIFSSIAANKDKMVFVEQTEDEEKGWVVEKYNAEITKPANANVVIYATFDKETNELKQLVMYTEDYDETNPENTTVYVNADTVDFQPEYEIEEGQFPNCKTDEGWTKVTS